MRKNDIGITVLASNAVTLNIWVFGNVFLGTLWSGILGAAVTLMVFFVLVRVILGKRDVHNEFIYYCVIHIVVC